MSMVIVTQNQYLLCNKIHHICLNEHVENNHYGSVDRYIKELTYNITILYVADSAANNGIGGNHRDELRECTVNIRGKVNAHKVYRDLIRQIRDQMPDQLFLDKAFENIIGYDLEMVEKDEEIELKKVQEQNDGVTKKVRRAGKAKRNGQKVLRKSKARR